MLKIAKKMEQIINKYPTAHVWMDSKSPYIYAIIEGKRYRFSY